MGYGKQCPKRLIVEGEDDKYSVIGLMKRHVAWPQPIAECPVYIDVAGGVDRILDPVEMGVQLKASNVKTLGVMIDADDQPENRYQSLLRICSAEFSAMPSAIDPGGMIAVNDSGRRLGIWIMPDNSAEGCLETFLRYLVPNDSEAVWQHAIRSAAASRGHGARYRDAHAPKANLYTWLSWQDPPGQNPGRALTQSILSPESERAAPFVKWFRELYEL